MGNCTSNPLDPNNFTEEGYVVKIYARVDFGNYRVCSPSVHAGEGHDSHIRTPEASLHRPGLSHCSGGRRARERLAPATDGLTTSK